jgi:hypothetical protein
MIARIGGLILAGALFGCLSTPAPLLTSAQATGIADTKATASGFNPRKYGGPSAIYDSTARVWWVRYYDRSTHEPMFAIRIEDKTGEATFKNREVFAKFVH